MVTAIATITSKGQVTIPKEIRQALDVTTNDQLMFVVEDNRVVVTPLKRRPLTALYGALPASRPYPGTQAIRDAAGQELGAAMQPGDGEA